MLQTLKLNRENRKMKKKTSSVGLTPVFDNEVLGFIVCLKKNRIITTFQEVFLIFYVTFYQISSFCRKTLISGETQNVCFSKLTKSGHLIQIYFVRVCFLGKYTEF
jgi:hypothetical protein